MRSATAVVSKIALKLDGETLVHDIRLDRVYMHLSKLVKFPDGLGFATQIQPAIPTPDPKLFREQPEIAVFFVTSPHPKAGTGVYPKDHQLLTVGSMPMTQWLVADKQFRHYAKLADPLRSIFAGLLRQHLEKRSAFEGLID
jgi:hypothetical protein